MHSRLRVLCSGISILLLVANCNNGETAAAKRLAGNYCGSCHLFPEPSTLDKNTWEKIILPKMSEKLGLAYYDGKYFTDAHGDATTSQTAPQQTVSINNWQKIVHFYTNNAPLQLPPQNRQPVTLFTDRFTVKEGIIEGIYPSTTFIKIDPGNQRIYAANAYDSLFFSFDKNLQLLQQQNIHKVAVDMFFENNLALPGERNGALTNIGILYPNNSKTGTLESFRITTNATLQITATIATELPRPVQTLATDIDKDGLTDYVICGFGNETGAFYYLRQKDSVQFEQQLLRPLPGAIKCYVDDYNKDGLPDIIALFAQAQEGIFLFLNKGAGNFETKELLRFPAVYGSTYFEMQDVNGDGLKDILYTCGDNLDYTATVLKNYHGIYIYLNKGNNTFEQRHFFPLHGCYKAIARDFDKDGDIDIAAISYFPDLKNQPQESFVYLENTGNFNLIPRTIKQYNSGNWVVMDAGDIDGDGDEDIVLGSMLLTITTASTSYAAGIKNKPSFLLLENKTR